MNIVVHDFAYYRTHLFKFVHEIHGIRFAFVVGFVEAFSYNLFNNPIIAWIEVNTGSLIFDKSSYTSMQQQAWPSPPDRHVERNVLYRLPSRQAEWLPLWTLDLEGAERASLVHDIR